MESATTIGRRALAARDALMVALLSACRDEIEALWERGNAMTPEIRALLHTRQPTVAELDAYDKARTAAIAEAVEEWCKEHRLASAWLIGRLTMAVKRWDPDDLSRPYLIWTDEEKKTSQGVNDEATIEVNIRAAAMVALDPDDTRRLASPWREIEARPMEETQEAFLNRARAHYRVRAEFLEHQGFQCVQRAAPELGRHARWFLLRRVKRVSYRELASAEGAELVTVKKAVKRFAAVVDL